MQERRGRGTAVGPSMLHGKNKIGKRRSSGSLLGSSSDDGSDAAIQDGDAPKKTKQPKEPRRHRKSFYDEENEGILDE